MFLAFLSQATPWVKSSDETSKDFLQELRKTALMPDAIARAVLYAVAQPEDVDVNEIIVRPTASAF